MIFWICRCCDRGQQYCSDHCRVKARREQRRAANLRHRRTPEGRLDQKDRQQDYRRRRAALRVMDQGSITEADDAKIAALVLSPNIVEGNPVRLSPKVHVAGLPCCIICGRTGRFVNPFDLRR